MIDTIHGADFQARHTLFALRAGEPSRVAVALAMEAGHTAYVGGRWAQRRSDRVIGIAETLAQRINHPYAKGLVELVRGMMDFSRGRWHGARDHCDRAATILRDRCTGAAWEIDTACGFALWARFYLGDVADLSLRLAKLLDDAQARGDRYAITAFRTSFASLACLAADRVEEARREIEEARHQWSHDGFQIQHHWMLLGEGFIDLYAGDGRRACERIRERSPALRQSLLLRIRVVRAQVAHLRGASSLAALAEDDSGDVVAQRVKVAEDAAADLMREGIVAFVPMALLLQAGAASLCAGRPRAMLLLDQASQAFDAAGMELYAAAARRWHGLLRDDEEGSIQVRDADKWMSNQGIRDPERMSRMLAPGFGVCRHSGS
jgi:hypothetical protein